MREQSWFTIFATHADYGDATMKIESFSAERAGSEAVDILAHQFAETEDDGIDEEDSGFARRAIKARVYAGRLDAEPAGSDPLWSFDGATER